MSLPLQKTTTFVISSSVKEHPSLKEMTVEIPRAQCSDSLVIGAVQGMAARRGMEKLALVLYREVYVITQNILYRTPLQVYQSSCH